MPLLNVSKVVLNPMFTETFTLVRRSRAVEDGRGVVTEETMTFQGIIQPTTNSEYIERINQGDWKSGALTIWSNSRFQINTSSNLPDEIIFENNRYAIIDVKDWSHFPNGRKGYMEITALLTLNDSDDTLNGSGYDGVGE